MRFVDTNVLREILDAEDLALSVQVLQEFYVQATARRGPSD